MNNKYYIGIDVGGTNIKIMIMNYDHTVLTSTSIPTQKELGYEKISDTIIKTIEYMFISHSVGEKEILSIGMGLPGTVDNKRQKTLNLAYLEWNGFNPCKKIGDYFSSPTFIDNDANINVLGEYYFGLNREFDNVILLTIGTGLGCGIIIEGKLFRGAHNLGAEIGHMTIETENGLPCLCGKTGHLESYCSGSALTKITLEKLKSNQSSILRKYIADNNGQFEVSFLDLAVKASDPLGTEIFDSFMNFLAIGIANIMKIFNTELVIIGGGISKAESLDLLTLQEKIKYNLLNPEQLCEIRKAQLGEKAGMYGACILAHIQNI